MIQYFSKGIGFGNKGYFLINFEKKSKTILISGCKSNYNLLIKKIEKISKKKPIHIKVDDKKRNSKKFLKFLSKKIKLKKPDNILVLGGGSIIDFAKRIYIFQNKSTKFFIFPSLPGSGAENSITSIINFNGKKDFLINKNFLPDGVIYDDNLMNTCKTNTIIKGIIDSITHCIESMLTINTNHYLSFLSVQTVNFFIKKYPVNFFKKKITNYQNICLLSFNGGLSQSNAGSGICHALSHSAEKMTGEKHSKCISFFILPILKYLKIQNKKELKNFSNQTVKYITDLIEIIKKKESFKNLNSLIYNRKKLDELFELAQNDPCWRLYKNSIKINLLKKILLNERNYK